MIFIIIFTTVAVILLSLLPTYYVNRKKKISESDWAVADRSLPIYVVIGTQFASAMGGGILVGQVTNAYNNGIAIMVYGMLSLVAFLLLMTLAKWLRRNSFSTVPEIISRFTNGNKLAVIVAAMMTIFVPFGWVTSQITAFGSLYSELTGLNYKVLVIVFCIVGLLFVLPSGLKTVAWTDFVFSCFMIAMCIIIAIYVGVLKTGHQLDNPALVTISGSVKKIGLPVIFLWIFAVLPGLLTNQIFFQRICAIDNERGVNKSLLISGILTMIAFGWSLYMGISIRSVNPNIVGGGAIGWLLKQMPTALLAGFATLVFATLMSTMSSGVQSVVVNITRDIFGIIKPNYPADKMLNISRLCSVAVIVVALLMCLVFTNTLSWLVNTYSASAATLLCPIYVGYMLRKTQFLTTGGIISGMLAGAITCFVATGFRTTIPPVAIGMVCSLIAMLVVSLLTKNNAAKSGLAQERAD
jgi:SSS family solute:Na+ symporter